MYTQSHKLDIIAHNFHQIYHFLRPLFKNNQGDLDNEKEWSPIYKQVMYIEVHRVCWLYVWYWIKNIFYKESKL